MIGKFKVWDGHALEFIDEVLCMIYLDKDGQLMLFNDKNELVEAPDHYQPIFLTGKTDKNGVELFDGDIFNDPELGKRANFLISFDNEKVFWKAEGIDRELRLFQHSFRWKDCIKIGNKFSNPELMETK